MRRQKNYRNLIIQPERFTPELAQRAADVLSGTGSMRKAARAVGAARRTLFFWRRQSPEFDRAWTLWRKRLLEKRIRRLVDAKHEYEELCRKVEQENWGVDAGYREIPQPERPLPEAETGGGNQFRITPEEERRMWEEWNSEQERRRQEELEADRLPGIWTGG